MEDVVAAYKRDGAVVVRGVFDPEWVDRVRTGIAKNITRPSQYSESLKGSTGTGYYFNDYCNWSWIPEFSQYIHQSPAAELAAKCMGAKQVSFYHEHVLNKEPGTSKRTPWHQDQPYYPIDGDQVCSLWMPVDPVPRESSLQFVAGSHRWDKWFIPRKFATENNYPLKESEGEREQNEEKGKGDEHIKENADRVKADEGKGDEERNEGKGHRRYYDVPVEDIDDGKWPILQWACEPGDVVVFHMRTLHGAAGNTSITTHRRVLSTRWLGDDAHLASRPWDVSPPITGGLTLGARAVCETFPLVYPRP